MAMISPTRVTGTTSHLPRGDAGSDGDLQILRGTLRGIREELGRLLRRIEHLGSRAHGVVEEWAEIDRVFAREEPGITQAISDASDFARRSPQIWDAYSDALVRVGNGWEDLGVAWLRVRDGFAGGAATTSTEQVRALMADLVLSLAYLTVPARVNENLREIRVGGVLDFNRDFGDEIPDPEHQRKLLGWMLAHPRSVEGLIDVSSGTIVRGSPHAWRRALSFALIAVTASAAVLAGARASQWMPQIGLTPPRGLGDAATAWALVVAYAGAIAHVLVAGLKQLLRSGPSQGFAVLGNLTLWVHVNEGYMLTYALAVPVACVAALYTTAGAATAVTAFLVGYSVDSFLEVFLTRFDKWEKSTSQALHVA